MVSLLGRSPSISPCLLSRGGGWGNYHDRWANCHAARPAEGCGHGDSSVQPDPHLRHVSVVA
eukprot:762047-Pyramimonas_sp.AAC.1